MIANVSITVKASRANDDIQEIARVVENWPPRKKDAFSKHWKSMEAHGCEIADTLFKNSTLHVAISDDFRRAVAEFEVTT